MLLGDFLTLREMKAGGPGSGRHKGFGTQDEEGLFHARPAIVRLLAKHGYREGGSFEDMQNFIHKKTGENIRFFDDGNWHHWSGPTTPTGPIPECKALGRYEDLQKHLASQ